MNKHISASSIALLAASSLFAQQPDTNKVRIIEPVEILTTRVPNSVSRLNAVDGTQIYSGKKNEVIQLTSTTADLSVNNTRQVFAKVPGITIWENDGSGIQVGISARGLSPNRSWEFNVRQNGYDISAEMFGYPEAYYSPPMEALSRIEVVRGASSLQYGPQFGGLLNYVMKTGSEKPFEVETQQTVGSYGLFNSYTGIGGTKGKISYYVFYHHRGASGWRENSRYHTNTGYGSLRYSITPKLTAGLQYTRTDFVSQQPGGLTDAQFAENPQQSLRSRNWFDVPWNVAAFTLDHEFCEDTKLSLKIFSTVAERNSVGFTKAINIADTINDITNAYNPRQVDRDNYQNYGAELRFLKSYQLFGQKSSLATGARVYKGETKRRQQGTGTTGTDVDMTISALSNGYEFARELNFGTKNIAVFAENMFRFGKKLSITPGIRFEMISSSASGRISTSNGEFNEGERSRQVLLSGIGTEYQVTEGTNVYANFSQAFRPVTFSELTPSATSDSIDVNLKDASGFNLDFGYRGKFLAYVNFDIGGFFLKYDNRIGTITLNNVNFRTNIGTSESKGLEAFAEADLFRISRISTSYGSLFVFASYSYIDARYTRWDNPAIASDPTKSVVGKRVEYSPEQIGRYGATYSYRGLNVSFQLNSVSEVFADASNTETANAAATTGKIAGYTVMDLSAGFDHGKYKFKAGVNNLADEKYATRRSGGYPGPGLLPANGRTVFFSFGVKI